MRPDSKNTPRQQCPDTNRLSKPSLAHSDVLPPIPGHDNLRNASLAYPSQRPDSFPLTPLLTLPPSFGAAYVGEQFACTLCANNERPAVTDGETQVRVTDVQIEAELQTPSTQPKGESLELERGATTTADEDDKSELQTGSSFQRIVRHDLREEGTHVLAVTVTYTEAQGEEIRTRTFRKLYQFVAQQALGIRTKMGALAHKSTTETTGRGKMFALEAQVENLTEQAILLDSASLTLGKALRSTSLNDDDDDDGHDKVLLAPQDVQQLAFWLEHREDEGELEENAGRYVLAQLKVEWRLAMGQDGMLKTGWLGCRKK